MTATSIQKLLYLPLILLIALCSCSTHVSRHSSSKKIADVQLDSLRHQAIGQSTNTNIDVVKWHSCFDKFHIGASEAELAEIMKSEFFRVETNTYCSEYPFNRMLPNINPQAVSEWRTPQVQLGGWPEIVFLQFADDKKSRLIDAFWFKWDDLRPLVNGVFQHNLETIRPGDSMDTVYRLLGRREAEYFRADNGRWHVRFNYWGFGGRLFYIEADAAKGRVVAAGDGTI